MTDALIIGEESFTYVFTNSAQTVFGPIARALPSGLQDVVFESQTVSEASSLEWLAAHLDELTALYRGNWILVSQDRVIAASTDPSELERRAAQERIDNPLITRIGKEPIVWKTAYAR